MFSLLSPITFVGPGKFMVASLKHSQIRVTCIDRDRGLFYAAVHGGLKVPNLLVSC